MDIKLVILFLLAITQSVSALTCYKCQNLEATSSGLFSSSFDGKTDSSCKPLSGYVPSTTCPSGYKCGYIGGTVTVKVNYFFSTSITVRTDIRDCLPAISHADQCYKNEQLTSYLSTIFGFLSSFTDVSLDGKACYCSESYCDANAVCKFPGQQIGDECYTWFWPVVGGVVVLIIIAIISCVCCCSSSKRSGVVVAPLAAQGPAVNVIQVPNRAYAGVGYGQNVQVQQGYAAVHQPYAQQPAGYSGPPAYTNNPPGPPAYNNPPGPPAYNNPGYSDQAANNSVQDPLRPEK